MCIYLGNYPVTEATGSIIPLTYSQDSWVYAQLFAHWQGFVWLDSGTRREYCGHLDLISARPSKVLIAQTPWQIELTDNGQTRRLDRSQADLWLEQQIHPNECEMLAVDLPFNGGLIGYIGYEWQNPSYKIPIKHHFRTPLVNLGLYDWAIIVDHDKCQAYCLITAHVSSLLLADILSTLKDHDPAYCVDSAEFTCGAFSPTTAKQQYLADAQTILDYINAGDCYQVNYSQCFTAPFNGSALAAYYQLRRGCPGPFSAYISTEHGAIMSLSPEQFIQIDGNLASSRPIKGTAARQDDPSMDKQAAANLQASGKNRAENLMIVDLLRNDFSKNCLAGTVKVPELFGLYTLTNVHHLISHICGTIAPCISSWRFIQDAFPGGSITGAPKKRAMEIIAQLEPHQRHIYCGCIGFWSRNNQARTNIAIRTLLIEDETIAVWGGGGVVADSEPESEYRESLDKIAAFKTILLKK